MKFKIVRLSGDNQKEAEVSAGEKQEKSTVRWGDEGEKYALVHLAPEGGQVRPAGARRELTQKEILEHPRSLVFGERSGGGQSFLSWLMEARGLRWVFARGYRWLPEHFSYSADLDKKARTVISEHLILFAQGEAAERARHLVRWARSLKAEEEPVHLLVRDLGGLGSSDREKAAAAQALRIFAETMEQESRGVRNSLRILVVSTSEDRFEDRFDASGFAITCERYRLPWLEAPEVQALAEKRLNGRDGKGKVPTWGGGALESLMMSTGGQPHLVQELLTLLNQEALPPGEHDEIEKRWVRLGFRLMRRHPPSAAGIWRDDLAVRLREVEGLANQLRFFVSGGSVRGAGLKKEAYSLMYSGWIRFDRSMERWKMASKLHRALASQVLSEGGFR